ncbi:MAG: HD domain-containing protein [Chitinivibrionales bacterium]|nr:HD domain-containing protein [Chitinivibrionales bacterium]
MKQQQKNSAMISPGTALAMLQKYGLSQSRIRHCRGVARFAYNLAHKIADTNPELAVNPEKVRIAGLLHDIGRYCDDNHELRGVEILRAEGLHDIAEIIMHGSAYELSVLNGKENIALLPSTLENKIVAYADARFRLEPVSLRDRIDEVKQRRCDEPAKIRSVEMAIERFTQLENELLALARKERGDRTAGGNSSPECNSRRLSSDKSTL